MSKSNIDKIAEWSEVFEKLPYSGTTVTGPGGPSSFPAGQPRTLWFAHLLMDALGFIPIVGETFDLANAAMYCAEGKFFDAVLSLASMITGYGDAIAKSVRYSKEGIIQLAAYRDEILALLDAIDKSSEPLSPEDSKNPAIQKVYGHFSNLRRYTKQMKAALYEQLNKI